VIKAVKNTLLYFSGHKNELFETAQRVATERAESTDE
jgi:hypothetical protein